MFREDSDRYDDIINPFTPWRSAVVVFLLSGAAVLGDVLDLPIIGRWGRRDGFEPLTLLFPVLAMALYLVFWRVWRIGLRNQQRRSRALRERLRGDVLPPGD